MELISRDNSVASAEEVDSAASAERSLLAISMWRFLRFLIVLLIPVSGSGASSGSRSKTADLEPGVIKVESGTAVKSDSNSVGGATHRSSI